MVSAIDVVGYDPCSHHSVSFGDTGLTVAHVSKRPHSAATGSNESAVAAVYYLSGFTSPSIVMIDGATLKMAYWRSGRIEVLPLPKYVKSSMSFCIGGAYTQNATSVADFCDNHPSSTVFACPIVSELRAIGCVITGSRPTREFVATPNTEEMSKDSLEYWKDSEGDKYGKMARQLSLGSDVFNDIYRGIGKTAFYGSTLSMTYSEESVVVVSSRMLKDHFLDTPISAKNYAATSVPVMMRTPDLLARHVSGVEYIKVMVVSDYITGLSTFMTYHKLLSGKDWVFAKQDKREGMPVFRFDKVYK